MKSLFTRKSLAVVSALFVASIVTSCHDEEVANIEELSYRHGYEYNFVKTFGEIDPNQTWDFSSYARRKNFSDLTRATLNDFGMSIDNDGYFRVPSAINDWIDENVMEENGMANNKIRVNDSLWHAFSFEAVNTDAFDLVPFYLGASQCTYNFHMVVVDPDSPTEPIYDGVIWESQNTQIQWTNGNPTDPNNNDWKEIEASPGQGGGHGSTIGKSTRGKPIRIDFSETKYGLSEDNKKYTVYFYVYIKTSNANPNSQAAINEAKDVLTSITDQPNLVAIDLPDSIDSKLNDGGKYNTMIFACETGSAKHADKLTDDGRADFDYNDFMFILVGRIPEIYYDEMLQTTTIKKRYMIEDLTGFDFDFNDIVVDLTDISVHYYIIDEDNGIKEEKSIVYNNVSYPTVTQKASFVYCCGTLPFQVKIGDKEFNRVTDPTDADNTYKQLSGSSDADNTKVTQLGSSTGIEPGYTYTYEYQYSETSPKPEPFWNPDANNISATIWTERKLNGTTDSSAGVDGPWAWVSNFPNTGDVPFIIATDQSVNWSGELTHVDFNWLGGDMSTDNSYEVTVVPVTTTTNP